MENKKIVKRTVRKGSLSDSEKARLNEIRAQVMREFPPAKHPKKQTAAAGIPAQIRRAREARGLSWHAVAKLAGIPNSNTVRDVEYGLDAKFSNVEAIATALGLKLEAVEV